MKVIVSAVHYILLEAMFTMISILNKRNIVPPLYCNKAINTNYNAKTKIFTADLLCMMVDQSIAVFSVKLMA